MDYGNLLSRAWRIVWRNKYLFVLGFLAALGSGGQRSPQANYQITSGLNPNDLNQPLQQLRQFWAEFGPLVLTLTAVVIVLGVIVWLLRLIAEAGLIDAVQQIEQTESPGLGGSFRAGGRYLGRMIGLNLVLYGPLWLFGLLMAAAGLVVFGSLLVTQDMAPLRSIGVLGVCLVPIACVLAIYGVVAAFVYPFAQRGIIITRLGVLDGIRHGWRVLGRHLGDIILLALLFLVISFLVGLVVALIALPIGIVLLLPTVMAIVRSGSVEANQIVLGFFTILGLGIISALINSVVRAFQSATFTLAYNEFMDKAVPKEEPITAAPPLE